MANEGGKPLERAISFAMRLVVSLILPGVGHGDGRLRRDAR